MNNEMNPKAGINPSGQQTVLNHEIIGDITSTQKSSATVLNTEIGGTAGTFLEAGQELNGGYVVQGRLDVNGNEADILLCKKQGEEYVAKVYRRQSAIKTEVVETLRQINSPYIAKIYAMEAYKGYPVEITEYYRNGSLQGKTFSTDELKSMIIPNLNEGLHALHKAGVIHKDLKPSNIMLSNDRKRVVILDFGISSVREDGSTVIRTQTGLTPEYSAPETFRHLFWSGSDYYSLGITLYQLSTGHTPYEGIPEEQLEQLYDLQKLPFPDDMDSSLKNLILALTYRDIGNRKDPTHPDRRWGYEEVNHWLKGVPQPIPGEGRAVEYTFKGYDFHGKQYTDMDSLLDALTLNWEDGKKEVFRATLARHFMRTNPDVSDVIFNASDELEKGQESQDLIYFRTLCKMQPERRKFGWKGKLYADLHMLGTRFLNQLRKEDPSMNAFMDELLKNGVLSAFAEMKKEPDALRSLLKQMENKFRTASKDEDKQLDYYRLAYALSEEKTMECDGQVFHSPDDIVAHMLSLLNQSTEKVEEFSKKLISRQSELNPQFECWLKAIGKGRELEAWKKETVQQ